MAKMVDIRNVRDISSDILDRQGRVRILPASFYENTTRDERAVLGAKYALYLLPTQELVTWLQVAIGGRTALEIGAGNGVLGEALGIPATDSHLQARPAIRDYYKALGQNTITYGHHVERLDALEAIDTYRPDVVVASWVTHKYDEGRHWAGGNEYGVDEEEVLKRCKTYIFIGNTNVHEHKSIWRHPHILLHPSWLYSRAHNDSADFIAVWGDRTNLPPI